VGVFNCLKCGFRALKTMGHFYMGVGDFITCKKVPRFRPLVLHVGALGK
jgi:hypothetical protein